MAKNEEKKKPEEEKKPGSEVIVYDFGDDAGKGMEGVRQDEYRIPFLKILDPKGKECKPVEAGGVSGARAGMVYNTSTGELLDGKKGFVFYPVQRKHEFIEWIPKDDKGGGGGFIGVHSPDEAIVGQLRAVHGRFGKLPMDNGHELAETFSLFGLYVYDDQPPVMATIAFSSTQIPKYQKFISRYMNITYPGANGQPIRPPLWAHRWRFNTVFEQKGEFSWYGWKITLDAKDADGMELHPRESLVPRTAQLYLDCKTFYTMIEEGKAKVDYNQAREPGDDTDDIAREGAGGKVEEEVPM